MVPGRHGCLGDRPTGLSTLALLVASSLRANSNTHQTALTALRGEPPKSGLY
jgi:hypothetical protein